MRYSDYLNQVAVRHRTASFNDLTRLSPGAPQPIDVSFKQAIGLLLAVYLDPDYGAGLSGCACSGLSCCSSCSCCSSPSSVA